MKNTFVCCALASFVTARSKPSLISYRIGEDYGLVGVAAPFRRSAYSLLDGVVTVALPCSAGSESTIKHLGWGRAARTKAIGLLRVLFPHRREEKKGSREGINRWLKLNA